MNLLCFDISSGGISAVLLDPQLESICLEENRWNLETGAQGAATLTVRVIEARLKDAIGALRLKTDRTVHAICIGTFMHNCVLLDGAGRPLIPVFTWLDRRGDAGVQYVRSRVGGRFHELTGCRYHPMFPVFKLAAIRLEEPELWKRAKRAASIKALLVHRLTGSWTEDHGTASASGLLNIANGDWDPELLGILGLDRMHLPPVSGRTDIAGQVTRKAAAEFGLAPGVPVIVGSGDGFLANIGSDCEMPARIAVTLGTSGVVRQTLGRPVLDPDAGTFCYGAAPNAYLLGCAGSNGGNVLDWGRRIFGTLTEAETAEDLPIFIPLLHGERSPDWDPGLKGSWHGLTARHTAADLSKSILEGVIFNLAHFLEIVQRTSGTMAADIVLSGNGFLYPSVAAILANVARVPTWMPTAPGMASLRGAGICALRALSQPIPPLQVDRVLPASNAKILERYREYRRLRAAVIS